LKYGNKSEGNTSKLFAEESWVNLFFIADAIRAD
jgi:hypothetical protein